jgi:hypothetical protein
MLTFALVMAVEVTDAVVALVVLVVERAATRKNSINVMLCFEAVSILDPPAA